MILVQRYLDEVSQLLPTQNRDDIIEELRTSIIEQIEDRAQSDGRDASWEDQKSVLQQFGRPSKVASSYYAMRSLIGPSLFPAFLSTLKVIVTAVVVFHFALVLILAFQSGNSVSLTSVFITLVNTALWVTGGVVAIFALLEASNEHIQWYNSWNPETLTHPYLGIANRSDVTTNFVSEGVFLLWWNDLLKLQDWIPLLGEERVISLSAAWQPLYWPLNILFAGIFIMHAYVLMRGAWHRNTVLIEIIMNVGILIAALYLLTQSTLVNFAAPDAISVILAPQLTVKFVILCIAGFTAWDIWQALTRLRNTL